MHPDDYYDPSFIERDDHQEAELPIRYHRTPYPYYTSDPYFLEANEIQGGHMGRGIGQLIEAGFGAANRDIRDYNLPQAAESIGRSIGRHRALQAEAEERRRRARMRDVQDGIQIAHGLVDLFDKIRKL